MGEVPLQALGLCKGTSLVRNRVSLGPYGRTLPAAVWWT